MDADNNPFPKEYFETHFELDGEVDELPACYTIITAYATTGETWPEEENKKADLRLKAELENLGVQKWRMSGYSPETGHCEPGWAVNVSVEAACEIGRRYLQHAIYVVHEGNLYVVLCKDGKQAYVGVMVERVHTKMT